MLGLFQLHYLQVNPTFSGGLPRHLPGVAMVDISDLHLLATDNSHLMRQCLDSPPFLLTGWCDVHCQQVAQRIDGYMHLVAALALVPVVHGAGATFYG